MNPTTKTQRSEALETRMSEFAASIILLTRKVSRSIENKVITEQLIRSATGIGANYTEANNAASRQDFRNKIFIAKKEAAETRYWLKLFAKVNNVDVSSYLAETTELLLILQSVVTTLKNGQ